MRHLFPGTINSAIALTFFVACPQIKGFILSSKWFHVMHMPGWFTFKFPSCEFGVHNEYILYIFMTQFISLAAIDSMTSLLLSKAKAKNVNEITLITSSAKSLGFCLNSELKIGTVMASGTSVPLQASGLQIWLVDSPLGLLTAINF